MRSGTSEMLDGWAQAIEDSLDWLLANGSSLAEHEEVIKVIGTNHRGWIMLNCHDFVVAFGGCAQEFAVR